MNEYPPNWKAIATRIKDAAGWKCERCGHPHDVEAGRCLTVHHLTEEKWQCEDWNLAALCQRCHLIIQGRVRFLNDYWLPHSAWMLPHVLGYNAWAARNGKPLLTVAT